MADNEKRLSFADSLGPEFQSEQLRAAGSIQEPFQNAANGQNAEKAQGSDLGSKMVSDDAPRHNMHPPGPMRDAQDRQSFNEKWSAELEKNLERTDDLYKDNDKFDKDYENNSEYDDEYEP